MSAAFAFECFADRDVAVYLRDEVGLFLTFHHRGGEGEVTNSLLKEGKCDIGMVDEDPGKTHHRGRDAMSEIWNHQKVRLLEHGRRFLVVVKPWLEQAFVNDMDELGLKTKLGRDPLAIRGVLGIRGGSEHEQFYKDLGLLYREARQRGFDSFILKIEEAVRDALRVVEDRRK